MGRDLSWYIIPKTLVHDRSKALCLNLEYEPEKDDKGTLIYNYFNKDKDCNMYCCETNKSIEKIEYSYLYSNEKNKQWCPICKMYMNGLYDSSIVLGKHSIHHSYSNPIWMSDWNIKDFYMGSSSTPFIRKFDKEHMYREIFINDINYLYERIEILGIPVRTSDKKAYEETIYILEFLKQWVEKDDIIVIMQDEL